MQNSTCICPQTKNRRENPIPTHLHAYQTENMNSYGLSCIFRGCYEKGVAGFTGFREEVVEAE